MGRAPSRLGRDVGAISRIGLAVAVGTLGVVMLHYPMIFSGFRRIQTDLGDTRLIHYLLEHGYRWVRREPGHLDFWSPPFFYPVKNVAAYSDVLLSVGPVYWLWRALGASPDLAFGLWIVSMSALNYAAGLFALPQGTRFRDAGRGGGCVAGRLRLAPRLNQLGHLQLLPFFFPLLTLYALSRLFGDLSLGRRRGVGYWLLAMAGARGAALRGGVSGVVPDRWSGIGGGRGAGHAVVPRVLFEVVRRDAWAIAAAGAGGVVVASTVLSLIISRLLARCRSQYSPLLRALHPTVVLARRGPEELVLGLGWLIRGGPTKCKS